MRERIFLGVRVIYTVRPKQKVIKNVKRFIRTQSLGVFGSSAFQTSLCSDYSLPIVERFPAR